MKIKQDKRVVSGEHDGEEFIFDGGVLKMYDLTWDKQRIQRLVTLANLLALEGFELVESKPASGRAFRSFIFGPSFGLLGDGTADTTEEDDPNG